MKKLSILSMLVLASLFFNSSLRAQDNEKKLISATGINFAFPIGDMSSVYNFGWGFYADIDYNLNKFLTARMDIGWNQFNGDDILDPVSGISNKVNQSVWEFTGGLRANLAFVYLEGRGGYFTGVNSWGFVPAVGVRFGNIDIQGNFTVAGDNHWGGVRVAYYWGNK